MSISHRPYLGGDLQGIDRGPRHEHMGIRQTAATTLAPDQRADRPSGEAIQERRRHDALLRILRAILLLNEVGALEASHGLYRRSKSMGNTRDGEAARGDGRGLLERIMIMLNV